MSSRSSIIDSPAAIEGLDGWECEPAPDLEPSGALPRAFSLG